MKWLHTNDLRKTPLRFVVGGIVIFGVALTPLVAFAEPPLKVRAFISPQNAPAPVYDADFQIVVDGDLFYPVQFPIRYLIDCRNDGSWELEVLSYMNPHFAYDVCDYPTAGVHTARVEVRSGNSTASGIFNITVLPAGSTPPPASPPLVTPSPTPSPATTGLSVSYLAGDPSAGTNFAYHDNLYITPGKNVEFEIRLTNHSSSPAQNVIVSTVLPDEFSYIIGSTKVDNIASSDGIAAAGIRLGLMASNQTKVIKFRARLADSDRFSQNPTKFSLTAQVHSDNFVPVSDVVTVQVVKLVYFGNSSGQVLGAAAVDTGNSNPWLAAGLAAMAAAFVIGLYKIGYRWYWRRALRVI